MSEECTKHLFNKISEGRTRVSKGDIEKFAVENGLPIEYVPVFYSKLIETAGPFSKIKGIDYNVFRNGSGNPVMGLASADRRGKITYEEMRIGLAHMLVKCPNSRCCYRSSGSCVSGLKNCKRSAKDGTIDLCSFRRFFLLLPEDRMMVEYWSKAGDLSECDMGCPRIQYQDANRKTGVSPWGHLVAGGVAGAASRTATAPLETLRIMSMTGTLARSPGRGPRMRGGGVADLVDAASHLVRTKGWHALYRGNLVNVVRCAPQKALDFFAFDHFKNAMSGAARPASAGGAGTGAAAARQSARPSDPGAAAQPGPAVTLAAAGLAGAVSNVLLYPLEVVRTRLSADTTGVYRGMLHAAQKIARKEGPHSLYRGVVPSVAAILPEAAITYGLFDLLKRSYTRYSGKEEAGVVASLTAGVVAAFTGQVVAYPLETVSRRMQSGAASSVGPAIQSILAEGGLSALFNGLGAASLRVVPMAIISFGTYEAVRLQVTKAEELWEMHAASEEAGRLSSSVLTVQV